MIIHDRAMTSTYSSSSLTLDCALGDCEGGHLRVPGHDLYGGGKVEVDFADWNLKRRYGLSTWVLLPSGVVMVTFCKEMISGGGVAFLAQSQNGWRNVIAALVQRAVSL